MGKYKVRLKPELVKLYKKKPNIVKGILGEKLTEIMLFLSGCKPIKLTYHKKGMGLIIRRTEIARELFKGKLTKIEWNKRKKLLDYLTDNKEGLPDYISFDKRKIFFVEAKTGNSNLSRIQKKRMIELQHKGYMVIGLKRKRKEWLLYEKGAWININSNEEQIGLSKFFKS